jgi:hypothetical protein
MAGGSPLVRSGDVTLAKKAAEILGVTQADLGGDGIELEILQNEPSWRLGAGM